LKPVSPAFGQADLSNCEREQIHLAGSIQPHGALLVVREPDLVIVQASANARTFLGLPGDPLGCSLQALPGDLAERVVPHLAQPLQTIPLALRCHVGEPGRACDALLHRPEGGGIVIELEPAGPTTDVTQHVEAALASAIACSTLRALCDEAAHIVKELTGYDRVMIYRFDEAGHGEVFSERREPHLEPYLGNRYPASDIPQIARRLYERNRVRLLVDVAYEPVPILPARSPITGADLDMSLCFLRSMSPIHLQYLKNMGVGATLVASLMVGGQLWGLVACHHYQPRVVHYGMRAVCELFAEIIATRIAALESFVRARSELSVRRLEQRMLEAIARDGDWKTALFDSSRALLQPIEAAGAAMLFEGQVMTTGEVPGTLELREIGNWLDERRGPQVYSTASLATEEPRFRPLTPVASGIVATAISNSPGEYLIWFRPERVRTVTWAGDPLKPVLIGNDPADLSPRRSFAQWHQVVEGTSDPWTTADLSAARLIGEAVTDVVLQFRAVRMLIAQNQLTHVTRQVRDAGMPVVVADTMGRILLGNTAFEKLSRPHAPFGSLLDLATLFQAPVEARLGLQEMIAHRRSWRAEVALKTADGTHRPFLVRGDPVLASPDQVLGFVLLLSDLTQAKAADAARRRFQEGIVERNRVVTAAPDTQADLLYRNLLVSVFGNAQLAALEITDGMDASRMPEMLDGVRASMSRTAQLLEYLVWHTARNPSPEERGPAGDR